MSYSTLVSIDTPAIPPPDTASEALYSSVKLDHLLRGEKSNLASKDLVGPSHEQAHEAVPEKSVPPSSAPGGLKLLRVIVGAHQGWVRSVVPDPVTNAWFVTGSSDTTIKIWDLASSKLKATITGHIMDVRALAVSKKYPYLFSGSNDKTVRCWDLERTNHPLGCQVRNYHGHVGGVYAMALHPELDLLFTGGRDQVVRVWDIRSRTEVMVLTGHRSDITSIAADVGDPQVVTSSMDLTVRLWDIRKQTTQLALTHHSKSIRSMVMHPEEATICSGDSSGSLKQFVLPGGDLLNEFGLNEGIINSVAVNADNQLFAGYDDGKMELYDYVSGNLIHTHHTKPTPGSSESSIYASCYDMLGLRLLTAESDKSVKVWGLE